MMGLDLLMPKEPNGNFSGVTVGIVTNNQDPENLGRLFNEPIAYAEEEENTILHYTEDNRLILIEILNFRGSISEKTIKELLAS